MCGNLQVTSVNQEHGIIADVNGDSIDFDTSNSNIVTIADDGIGHRDKVRMNSLEIT